VVALLTGAYIAAVFLANDSVRAGLPDLARAFRARALRPRALVVGRRRRRDHGRLGRRPGPVRAAADPDAGPRIVGVALLFGFIVSGVFLVADPAFLDRDEE